MSKIVFFDLDGVLVDFQVGAAIHHGADVAAYRASNLDILDFLRISKADFFNPLDEDFWAGLDWTEDGKLILGLVEGYVPPENICVLSSAIETPGCYDGKKRWIRRHMPAYRDRFLIGPSKYFCAHPGSILLDDRDKVVNEFVSPPNGLPGGCGIVVPRPWNSAAGLDALAVVAEAMERFVSR